MNFEGAVEYFLFHYRYIFVCFILLPCSFLYDVYTFIKNKLTFNLKCAALSHEEKVKNVQKQVRDWIQSGKEVPMCTARPGWKTTTLLEPQYKSFYYPISVEMYDILKIDEEKKTVTVEPLANMGKLTSLLLPLGWTIPVLPELEDLTVGGLVCGQGVESTSHIYGLFQHTCVSYEIVLADGSLVKCSKDENPDLFYSIPWSYGTLGFLTAVEIQILPAKKYVKLAYKPTYSLNDSVEVFEEESRNGDKNFFVEGIMFSKEKAVIMTGNLVDEAPQVNVISRWYKPWFFTHVESFLEKGEGVDYIPLRDYYHRHTRSLFWEIQAIIPFGNHWLFRWVLGWMTPPKIAFLKLTQTSVIKKLYLRTRIIEDLLPPMSALKECINYAHEKYGVYPIWLCPFKLPSSVPGLVHANGNDGFYLDLGIYGQVEAKDYDEKETNKKTETFIKNIKGFKMLYSATYFSKEEFYEMFDHSLYDKVRKQYNCEKAFPLVYDKVTKKHRN